MKAIFPNARIPLNNDLLIVSDKADGGSSSGNIFIILGVVFSTAFGFISISAMTNKPGISFFISIIIGISLGFAIRHFYREHLNKNRVQLENIEFEKLFDVKCEDQVTSRMIITPAFMDRIISFVNKTGNKYEFLLQGNIMYIKRQIYGNYLEAGTEKNMLTNVAGFTQFYTDMREIIQFVYDMNLMYLSKTDTSTTITIDTTTSIIKPIQIENNGNTRSGFMRGLLSRFRFSN